MRLKRCPIDDEIRCIALRLVSATVVHHYSIAITIATATDLTVPSAIAVA